MSLGGNLDSTQFAAAVSNGGSSPANLFTVGTTIYDSLGNSHLVTITFTPTDTAPLLPGKVISTSGAAVTGATAWEYTVSSTDGTQFDGSATSKPQFVLFGQNGQFINTSGGGNVGLPASVHLAGAVPSEIAGDQVNVTKWGTPANTVTGTKPATPGAIAIDMSALTSNAAASSAVSTGQNGYPPGTLSSISVGRDGTVSGSFTNGQSKTLAQVALATFQNEQGLFRAGGNQYQQSVNSGAAKVGSADTGNFGSITGGALELSNVSIGDQFTKLIVAQNAFTANSKSITTGNEVLQTAIALSH
jgi:flagellar hook protein FlgE